MNATQIEKGDSTNSLRISFDQHEQANRKRVYNLAFRISKNATDAEDITQEAFTRAWASYPTFDQSRSFTAWIMRIATNICLDQRRRLKYMPVSLESVMIDRAKTNTGMIELSDSSSDPTRCLMASTINERLVAGLARLPRAYRECLLLLYEDNSYEEIARKQGCELGTVRSRIHRSRAKMRRFLE